MPRSVEKAAWRWQWRMAAWGREDLIHTAASVPPAHRGARVEYARGALVEWYENRKEGLEQGFTISAAPDGMGMLCIEGRFSDELRPELDASGTALDLFDARGVHVLRYAGLVVQDATQRRLNAHLALSETSLRILVDDRDAVYPIVVDPLMTSPSWTGESNQTGGYFGVSVGTAGDVNGDGYSDVIVGAHQYDSGQNDEGRAFVYLGSSTGLVSSPAWTAESDQAGAFFGTSVSTAGDVNGDGYGDVIVGANLYDNVEDGEGRAFVYLGSSSGLADSAAWTAESNQGSAAFGVSVATAGDVNGDGYSDVIVGAYFYDNGQSNEGAAFVYLGSSSGLASSAAWTGESDQVNAVYGISVASAGDVNGDGYSDVIVGSHQYDNGQTEEGRAFVYFGSSTGLATSAAWTAESDQTDGKLGWSVAAAGDVNGDGYGDVIVGALNYSNGQTAEGRAFVYLGSSTGPATSAAWTAESNQGSAWFGYSVATAGDVNGDGYSDVIVGARDYSNGQPIEGRAYMYLGSASGLAASSAWTAESDQTSAYFGISVATAGDVNGDGYSDVIVGAYAYDNGQPDEGSAFAYLGSASGLATAAGWTAESNQGGTMFGVSVASAGDVNGDGYSDVIVGAHRYDHDLADEGRAFVYLGSASGLAASAAWTAESDQAGAFFGHWVASAGDVNGDGYGDVIVGARRYDNGESEEGRAYVYLGSASGLATSAAWTAEGDQDGANFGWSAATAGDVNGDGFGDVIVGANMYTDGQSGEGKAFVYLGSSSGLATSASWTAEGNQTGAAFGVSVASAGDVNGDAYSDVIIGAYKYTNGQSEEGRAFLYLGSASGLATSAAWTAESDQTGALFGISAATAGDVNGDGYSDVIVGASGYGNGQSVEGRAFVYIGSGSGLASSAAWTAESDQAGAQFGYSVATAGDVNGDGYSDVIVGARDYMNGQTDEGRAFAYLGSGSGLAITAAWTAESDQLGAEYGLSVANAGDVNGDGYGDVIVGAWSYDNGQTDEGRSFAYFGNGGDGLDRIPQQRRADDTTPIAPLGKSDSKTMFRLKALGRTPAGRGQVRLVAEVKPLLSPFTGVGISAGPWVNTGLPAIGSGSATLLNNFLTGLSPAHVYHWRIRVETTSPFFPRSPWFSPSHNGAEESDFRTAGFDVQPLFGPWTDFATATGPRSVATGDFNGDGRPDLAVADSSDDKVSVLLGSGTGTFGAKTDFATREGPASVAIGDFNDDGRRDLAVVGAGGDAVSVLLGIGNGTFGPKADFGTGVPPVSVATEDLNGDVDLDLAVANKGDNTVSVLLGNGSGSFGANSDFATGSSPVSVAIADLNADTKPDLAVANQASNTISVLLGNGLGSFSLASNPETGTSPSSVAIRDLNGNGVPDLVATNRGSNTVSVLLGNGNGTFGAKSDFGTGSSPASVAIADFDVDGKSDLAVANAGSNTVSVLLGNGNGTFGTKTDFGTGVRPECVVVADLNGDGRRDLAVACVASNRVSILLNQGGPAVPDLAPVVASPVSVNAEEGGTLSISVAAGDLDGEGITFLEPNLSSLPAGNDAVFTTNANHTSGTLIWHPKSAHAGTYNVIFTASNALSGSDTTRIDVAAAGASITGRLLWTPAAGETGVFDITYTATDAFGDTTFAVTRVTVTGGSGVAVPTVHTAPIAMKSPMRGPIISVASTSAISSGSTLVQTSSASGATTFTASTEALPAGNDATFATDVQPTVPAPITVSANPGEQVSISLSVSDPDGNPITSFTADLSSLPSGNNAVFTPNGTNTAGTFTWTPALADSGNYGVTFNAVNALVSSAQAVISVGNSLSAYWRLNGNGADGAKGNALVPVGGATFAAGKLNLAADVNGSGPSRLQAPASHAYDLLPAGFTAECWVKPRSLSFAPDPTIARADSGGDAEAWELFVCGTGCPTGRVGVRVRHLGSLTELVSTQLINDGTFHHVATTYDGATLKLYVDGVPDDSLATPGLEARVGGGMIVLGNSAAGTSQFDGFIDDFRIWTKVKTASQILTAMNSELGSPSGVGDQAPRFSFALFQNRPNPFNPHTRIRFDLPRAGHSRLYIYDVQGRLVTRLIDGELPAGAHTFDWSGSDARGRAVASGIYFYRLEAAGFSSTRRMALLR